MRLLLAAALVCAASAGATASETFCDAARHGDAKVVEKSLTNGVDVDYLSALLKLLFFRLSTSASPN